MKKRRSIKKIVCFLSAVTFLGSCAVKQPAAVRVSENCTEDRHQLQGNQTAGYC
jgi:hypothetical protein